jgi:Holliday junction resolvase
MIITTERQLQANIKNLLTRHGWLVRKMSAESMVGWPDLLIVRDGRVAFIEVKTAAGRVSKRQQLTHEAIREHGGQVYIWRSTADAERFHEDHTSRRG